MPDHIQLAPQWPEDLSPFTEEQFLLRIISAQPDFFDEAHLASGEPRLSSFIPTKRDVDGISLYREFPPHPFLSAEELRNRCQNQKTRDHGAVMAILLAEIRGKFPELTPKVTPNNEIPGHVSIEQMSYEKYKEDKQKVQVFAMGLIKMAKIRILPSKIPQDTV